MASKPNHNLGLKAMLVALFLVSALLKNSFAGIKAEPTKPEANKKFKITVTDCDATQLMVTSRSGSEKHVIDNNEVTISLPAGVYILSGMNDKQKKPKNPVCSAAVDVGPAIPKLGVSQ